MTRLPLTAEQVDQIAAVLAAALRRASQTNAPAAKPGRSVISTDSADGGDRNGA